MSNLKRFLALTLAMLMIVGAATMVSAKPFDDVKTDAYYMTAVDVLSNLGVVRGTGTDEFSPDKYVTREQMALFMARYSTGYVDLFDKMPANAPFADCKDPTYFSAIAQCKQAGIIDGVSATKFEPIGNITFVQAVKMVVAALGYKFEAANWQYDYMFQANSLGMLGTFGKKGFDEPMTRAEIAQLLYNAFDVDMFEYYVIYEEQDGFRVPVVYHKTIARDVFKCEEVHGVVTATKDLRMDYFNNGKDIVTPKTSKSVTNPVIINNNKDLQFNLTSDVNAAELLGVEVSYLKKNGNVVGNVLTVIGKKVDVTEAAYNNADGARKVTVNGELYNLNDYSEDRIIYVYNADGILKKVDHANYDAEFKLLNGGFYAIELIDNVSSSYNDVIVYYPGSVGKVGDNHSKTNYNIVGYDEFKDGAMKFVDIKAEANKDDYVVYFANRAAGIFKVLAKATKFEAQSAVTVYSGDWKAIFSNSKTYEALDTTALGVKSGDKFVAGQKFDIYIANDKFVYSKSYDPNAGKYNPKEYVVIDKVDKPTVSYGSSTYPLIYRNASGSSTAGTVSYANGIKTSDSWLKSYYADAEAKVSYTVGKIAVKTDSTKFVGYNSMTAFESDKTAANENIKAFVSDIANDKYVILGASASGVKDGGAANLHTFANNTDYRYAMADYSKVLVRYTKSNGGYEYVSYVGQNTLPEIATYNKAELVIHTGATVLPTIAFAYIETNEERKEIEVGDYYVVVGINNWANSKEYYDVLNPATGDRIVATYSDANNYTAGKATLTLGDMVRLSGSNIIVSSVMKRDDLKAIKYTDSGYFVLGESAAFGLKTDDTKIWGLNDDRNNYTGRGTGDIKAANDAYMEVDKNGKAIYVVFFNHADAPAAAIELSFNANSGTGSMGKITSYPAKIPANKFEKTGWEFIGWNTKADGTGTSYKVDESVTFTANTVLYAMWTRLYMFKYDANTDDETVAGIPAANYFKKDVSVTVTYVTPTRDGYVFKNWTTDDGTNYYAGDVIKVASDVTLKAVWVAEAPAE